MTAPTIRLEDRLAYLTPARATPRRVPVTSTPPSRGVGAAAAGQRAPIRALSRRRAFDPWRPVDALGRASSGDLALVVLGGGALATIALATVVRVLLVAVLGGAV